MSQPNFAIVGAQKAGTTAFWKMLSQHPEIFLPTLKEPMYWTVKDWPEGLSYIIPAVKDADIYASLFQMGEGFRAIGEASTMYLPCPWVAERLHKNLPSLKIICILRDPTERAFSHYLKHVRDGQRLLTNLTEEIWYVENRLFGSKRWEFGYVPVGLYYKQITRYLEYFPREQIKIYLYEELCDNPAEIIRDVCLFLGIDTEFKVNTNIRTNVAPSVPKRGLLPRFLHPKSRLARRIECSLPSKLQSRFTRFTKNLTEKPKLPDDLRKALKERFSDDVTQLAKLLNRDLTSWL
jgi:hypothetical protein